MKVDYSAVFLQLLHSPSTNQMHAVSPCWSTDSRKNGSRLTSSKPLNVHQHEFECLVVEYHVRQGRNNIIINFEP